MTRNIIIGAISAKFYGKLTEKQVESLAEVVESSTNPEVALEKLLGTFEKPDFDAETVIEKLKIKGYSNPENIMVTKTDDFNKVLHLSFEEIFDDKRSFLKEQLPYSIFN